jgi:hypothetical protein
MATTDGLVHGNARNVGGVDRKLRGLGGSLLVVGAAAAFASGLGTAGAVAALAGLGLLFNAVTGFCVMNALLGVDTCRKEC